MLVFARGHIKTNPIHTMNKVVLVLHKSIPSLAKSFGCECISMLLTTLEFLLRRLGTWRELLLMVGLQLKWLILWLVLWVLWLLLITWPLNAST